MAQSAENGHAEKKEGTKGKSLNKSMPTSPYVLVLLDAAKDMPEGTEQAIKAPYISLGRDSDCSICYGDDFPMVSRLHAAIEWNDDGYSLRHLSNTNQTLLNGRPIGRKWFLHDDDVIQLAPSGPKIKFKMPLIISTQPNKRIGDNLIGPKKDQVQNIALMAVIILAVLFTILIVYLTISD